jgi:predicted TIM-barrel fold metal-dependent hydrolase
VIFDAHTHLLQMLPSGDCDPAEVELMLRRMRLCGIDRAVLLGAVVGVSPTPTEAEIRRINDHTLQAVAQHPNVFTGFCYLNPANDVQFTLNELHRCIETGPMAGVKLWIAVNARDARLDPIMAWCAEHECPVLHHAWYKTVMGSPAESNPADISDLARRHPRTSIIMAHLVAGGIRGVLDVLDTPNISVDISGSQPFAGVVEYALERLGAERILYGSDWPVRDFATQLGKLDIRGLSDADRELIQWKNLHRLLGRRSPLRDVTP